MKKNRFILGVIVVSLLLALAACSSSIKGAQTPVQPDPPSMGNEESIGRNILAIYDAVIDPEAKTFTATPVNRDSAYHLALSKHYPNVLQIVDYGWTPNFWVNIRLTHPFPGSGIDGYDPRVIAILPANDGVSFNYPLFNAVGNNKVVLDEDGYTKLFDGLGGLIPGNTNPFKAYFKGQPYRVWSSTGVTSETQLWWLDLSGFAGPMQFKLVVDVSTNFPNPPTPITDNAPEPVEITNKYIDQGLTSDGGNAMIEVALLDWQGSDNIKCKVEAPNLFNGAIQLFYSRPGPNPNEYIFSGTITNELHADAGEHSVLIVAWDVFADVHIFDEAIASVRYKLIGINFSPYVKDGQDPNIMPPIIIPEEQIRELIEIIAPYVSWIRTFGTQNGLEVTGRIAREYNLQTAIGAWLGKDLTVNEQQIANLITMANNGEVDIAIVGSEVMLRGDLSESQLISYIEEVRNAIPSNIPVTTADVYQIFIDHPAIVNACDVLFANFYSYWEGIAVECAMEHVHNKYLAVQAIANGKKVYVSEAGWPDCGNIIGDAVPSPENAAFFFINFVSWARAENVDYFYFEAFNEPWKAAYEGPQGACWGIWDKDGIMKEGMIDVFHGLTIPDNWTYGYIPGGPGDPEIEFTYVPPYGSFEDLKGQVWHVLPRDHKAVVYIKVSGGWWGPKPYWANPLTYIQCNGKWTCDITTGGHDQDATEIVAFLVVNGYEPPSRSGQSVLPDDLFTDTLAWVMVERSP